MPVGGDNAVYRGDFAIRKLNREMRLGRATLKSLFLPHRHRAHLAAHLKDARKPVMLPACQMAVLSVQHNSTAADPSSHSHSDFRLPICTTLPAGRSQYAAHASISFRRLSSASLRRYACSALSPMTCARAVSINSRG